MAHLAQRSFDGLHFDEEIADFLEEVVEMVRANHVRHAIDFEVADVLAAAKLRNEIEDANPAAIFGRDAGEFTKGDKGRAVDAGDGNVGDYQGPFPRLQFRKELLGILHVANAPALGVEDLFDRTGALGIVVEDKDADLWGQDRGIGTHRTSITLLAWPEQRKRRVAAYRLTIGR